jgi:hypothetical protein
MPRVPAEERRRRRTRQSDHAAADAPRGNLFAPRFDATDPGSVRLVSCPNVADAVGSLPIWAENRWPRIRLVACSWDALPPTHLLLEHVLNALARAAFALWPHRFNGHANSRQGTAPSLHDVRDGSSGICGETMRDLPQGVFGPWLEAAAQACRHGQYPRGASFASAVRATQLALALDPRLLHLALCATGDAHTDEGLFGLPRGAEWLAEQTAAHVDVFVPLTISGYTVLRLTHDEVLEDVSLAVEKVRDLVAYCRARQLKNQEASR